RMTLQLFIERNRDRDTEPLQLALAELNRMERQVRRFLQIARPEPPHFEVAEVPALLERAARGLAATAEHQNVALTCMTAPTLPPVRVDPDQIGQVLTNLVANALDAAATSVGGHVRLRSEGIEPGRVALLIEDNGPGVSPRDEPRLFQPFFTTKPEGVGLGLALCHALIGEHGGTIAYERNEGWTRFRVILPAVSGPESSNGSRP